jgi:hypothetical protein
MNKRISARLILALAATLSLGLGEWAMAQVSDGLGGDAAPIPTQAGASLPVTSGDPFADPSARPSFSSVSALQSDADDATAALSPRDYFQMTLKDTEWQGHARRSRFRAVAVTLKNTQPVPVEIMRGEVVNGLDEQQVSESKIRAQELKQQAMNFLMRGSGMVSGFGVVGANNYGASAAMSPVPAMNFAPNTQVATAEPTVEAAVGGRFISRLERVMVNPQQTYSFKTLIPIGTEPQLRLTFRNLKTGQVVEF